MRLTALQIDLCSVLIVLKIKAVTRPPVRITEQDAVESMLTEMMIELTHDLTVHSQRNGDTGQSDYAASPLVSAVAQVAVEVNYITQDPDTHSIHSFPIDLLYALSQLPASLHQAAAAGIVSAGR